MVLMAGSGGDADEGVPLGGQLDQLADVCKICEEGDLHYSITQQFGVPGETAESVEQKLAFLKRIKPALANLRVGVRMLPGSAAAAKAREEGLISDEADLIKPTFYLAAPVRDWIVERLKTEVSHQPRWNLF